MRTAFIQELVSLARMNPRIFLVVGDLGFSVVEPFAQEYPDRFVNAGISEQNMTGLAAGLASEGYHVFTYSIANFPTFRCAEQIRNDIAYHDLAVTVVAVGGGLAYGNLGYSHHAVQDLAMLRTFPGMLIAAPGDPVETRACLRYLTAHPQPSYLRLGKAGEPQVHSTEIEVSPGRIVRAAGQSGQVTLLTTAATLSLALAAAAQTEVAGRVAVHSLPLWGAGYRRGIIDFVESHPAIITLEDHLRAGGLGSFVQECLDDAPQLLSRVTCLALDPLVCGRVASQAALNAMGGLSVERVVAVLASKLGK